MLAQTLIEGDVEALVRAAIDLAKKGDMRALRLCLNQLLPSRKHAPVACEFPPIEKPADSVAAMAAITGAVADGDLAPGEAAELAKVIDLYLKAAARSISTDGSRKWNNARQGERRNRIKQHVPRVQTQLIQ